MYISTIPCIPYLHVLSTERYSNSGPLAYKKVILNLFDEGWGAWYIITDAHVVLNTEKSCAANSEHG